MIIATETYTVRSYIFAPFSHSVSLCLHTTQRATLSHVLTRVILILQCEICYNHAKLPFVNDTRDLLSSNGLGVIRMYFPLFFFTLGGLVQNFSNGFIVFLLWRRGEVSNPPPTLSRVSAFKAECD